MTDKNYEKLGVFYLGRRHDLQQGRTLEEPLLYDSRDLTTHAMVVGMTGSGKTGLCLDLLEEAGIDGLPAIVIDPKGDVANLLLMFPEMRGEDFQPWIEPSEATRLGLKPEEYARKEADKWRRGLASWDQSPDRIRRFHQQVDLALYTPGSNVGRSLSVLKSFAAPPAEVCDDHEAFQERIASATSGLLGLLGIDADPVRSRDHILVSRILEHAWIAGRNLDLGQLIRDIQNPPFDQVGIIQRDVFYPAEERTQLAMMINNLLASPSFAGWMQGEPLRIPDLLYTRSGKPRVAIVSIAHLDEPQRMFFVTLLLNEIVAWMRTQAGTSSLRALLYMDEVFGYFPPVANPPSKKPMLTLLKQARAYGLGVVLATQNPVDLDYKGLANMGTWFLGRLQTENDKQRVLEGLEGAATTTGATFSRSEMEQTLSRLRTRQFLMNNVHEDHPVLFETRWALSYLRGPLSRNQLSLLNDKLMEGSQESSATDASPESVTLDTATLNRPEAVMLPTGITPRYLPRKRPPAAGRRLVYRPALVGVGRLHFTRSTYDVDHWIQRSFLVSLVEPIAKDPWTEAKALDDPALDDQPASGEPGEYAALPVEVSNARSFDLWKKQLLSFLYREQTMAVYKCRNPKQHSQAGQTEGEFRVQLRQALAEERDRQKEKLRQKFQAKYQSLDDRIQRAREKIAREKDQYSQKKWDSILSVGSTLLGAFMGRKTLSVTNMRRASSSMKSMNRAASEHSDIENAQQALAALQEQRQELESEFEEAVDQLDDSLQAATIPLEKVDIKPRKSDLAVISLDLVWLPYEVDSVGIAQPLFDSGETADR